MPLITLNDVISAYSTLSGSQPAPQGNTLQLVVNRFAHRFDADLQTYSELQIMRILSGAVMTPQQSAALSAATVTELPNAPGASLRFVL